MLGNLCSERVIGTVLLRRKSPESLQYDLEELGTPAIPRRDGLVEVENVFDCTSSPASSLLVWVK
jgi:hypothetical protein